jgi:hypothetical protein
MRLRPLLIALCYQRVFHRLTWASALPRLAGRARGSTCTPLQGLPRPQVGGGRGQDRQHVAISHNQRTSEASALKTS